MDFVNADGCLPSGELVLNHFQSPADRCPSRPTRPPCRTNSLRRRRHGSGPSLPSPRPRLHAVVSLDEAPLVRP